MPARAIRAITGSRYVGTKFRQHPAGSNSAADHAARQLGTKCTGAAKRFGQIEDGNSEHAIAGLDLDETLMLQDVGLYQPKYDLMNADAYKARLLEIRQKQKKW